MKIAISEAPGFYDDKKDKLSEISGRVCRESFENSPFLSVTEGSDHFRGSRDYEFHNLPEGYRHTLDSDGIGTKVVFADTVRDYSTLARDLMAMGIDDAIAKGAVPCIGSNVTDLRGAKNFEHELHYKSLMNGLAEVAREQNIVILTGETASLGACVGSPNPNADFPLNWSATFHSIVHEKLRITGDTIRAGDKVVLLKENGFRSNGGTLLRDGFEFNYGENWYEEAPYQEVMDALVPSQVYARAIAEVNGWYNWENSHAKLVNIKGIAHLSGGSFDDKLFRPLLQGKGLSANLSNLHAVPISIKRAVQWHLEGDSGKLDHPAQVYKSFSCGNGMAVILGSIEEAEKFISIVEKHGISGQIGGEIIETKKGQNPDLFIDSQELDDIYT